MGLSQRARISWWWVLTVLVAGYLAWQVIAHVVERDWWSAALVGLLAGFLLSGAGTTASVARGEFPSNRQWLRRSLISGGFAVAGLAVLVTAMVTDRGLHLSGGVIIWGVAGVATLGMLPRAVREYRSDPDGSYFRQRYDERQAKQTRTWPPR